MERCWDMSIVKNEKVTVKWNGKNREYYESKGYTFNKYGDPLQVEVSELAKNSNVLIKIQCDYCRAVFERKNMMVTNRQNHNHFCSIDCEDLYKYGCSKEDRMNRAIQGLTILSEKLGRYPTTQEYDIYATDNGLIQRRNLTNIHGSTFNEICDEFLTVDKRVGKYSHYCFNKNGERCSSLPEMVISNIFIDNDIKYTYEPYYREVVATDVNYRFDWKINYNNADIYIEYFGFYHSNSELNNDYISKANEKMRLCDEGNVNLISLYRKDLKNNFIGLIDKFTMMGIGLNIDFEYLNSIA
jgi:hypothetical protein